MDKGTRLSVLVGVLLGPRGMEHMFFGSFVLIDSGVCHNFISQELVQQLGLKVQYEGSIVEQKTSARGTGWIS